MRRLPTAPWRCVFWRLLTSAAGLAIAAGSLAAAQWVSAGPEGGRILALVVDPDHPEVLYAGGSTVFRSGDGGTTWEYRGRGLPGATSLAMSGGVLYAAQDFTYAGAAVVWRSADGGLSWQPTTPLPVPWWAAGVTALVADPQHPGRIWAVGWWSIWLTKDGGAHWVERSRGIPPPGRFRFVESLVLDPREGRLWAATRYGVFTATGDARLWTKESEGLRSLSQIETLTVDSGARVVLAGNINGLYRRQGSGPWRRVLSAEVTSLAVFGDLAFAVVSLDFEGTASYVLRSEDHGLTWMSVQQAPDRFVRSLAGSSAGFFAGTSTRDGRGGVYRSIDGGETWHPARRGLTSLRTQAVATGPAGDGILYAASGRPDSPWAELARSRDGGASWEARERPDKFSAMTQLLVDPNDADTLYATTQYLPYVARSVDGGATWDGTGYLPDVRTIRADPREAHAVWAVRPQSLHHLGSGDFGFQEVPTFADHQLELRELAVDGRNPSVLWLGGAAGSPASARLFHSDDGGQTWTRRDSGITGAAVTSIALDPATASDSVYAATDAGLYRSSDAGASWTAVPGLRAPVSLVLATATSPTTVWVVSGDGSEVRRSRDGGTTWEAAYLGLEGAPVLTLVADPLDPTRIWAGTATRSVMAWSE